MENEEAMTEDAENLKDGGGSDPRQRSTIGFPYASLDEVESVAFAIYNNVAFGSCSDDQLAPWLDLSAKSSGFRVRVSAARMFGVIETDGGSHSLTGIGKMIVDPMRQREGRVEAFMAVPLFAKVFDEYKGVTLPPAAALERAIEAKGVAPKQKTRARQVLERSAEQAGFFAQGKNRLVKPGVAGGGPKKEASPDDGKGEGGQRDAGAGGNGGGGPSGLDDLIKALVAKIPVEAKWDAEGRASWLKAAVMVFDLVYGPADQILVQGPTEIKKPHA